MAVSGRGALWPADIGIFLLLWLKIDLRACLCAARFVPWIGRFSDLEGVVDRSPDLPSEKEKVNVSAPQDRSMADERENGSCADTQEQGERRSFLETYVLRVLKPTKFVCADVGDIV